MTLVKINDNGWINPNNIAHVEVYPISGDSVSFALRFEPITGRNQYSEKFKTRFESLDK